MEKQNLHEAFLFVTMQIIIFSFFYLSLSAFADIFFYLYMGIAPVIFVILISKIRILRENAVKSLASKDMIIFFSVMVVWLFIYPILHQYPPYVLEISYYPVILEEINFRFIIARYIGKFTGLRKATIFQAVLFALFYLSVPIMEPYSYPGIYLPLFIFDTFGIGLVYGALYYIRKNIYLSASLHLALYAISPIIPAGWGFIPYTLTEV
ncbi:CPBP family intramembrane metalloprotease [Oxyplasma meridianum]|uniref:CPBP family intramembrane metalloprotease n=1 Tax=Oxyplasma meridianum TaxID=3073602 RepID=A0AAX4NGX8_9ARCH